MKKILYILVITSLFACHSKNNKESNSNKQAMKVGVYYLHQKNGCPTCKAIGKISKATTNKYFDKEVSQGKVVYFDLDITDKANDSIAKKFECTWAGLYIFYKIKQQEYASDFTDVGFMYAINKPDTLEQIIKTTITKKLEIL